MIAIAPQNGPQPRRGLAVALGIASIATGAGAVALCRAGAPSAALALAAAGAVLVAALALREQQRVERSHARLRAAFQALASGDVGHRVDPAELGWLADLGAQHNELAEFLRGSAGRVAALSRHLQQLPERIADALAEVEAGAENQEAAVEETASLLANINTSIRGINQEVEGLARSNEETASSILQMGSAVEQLQHHGNALQESVEGSTASVHEMSASIRHVAESAETVQQVAEETAASIVQMDRSIREVGEHARGASDLTEQVSQSAAEGAGAVRETIEGIAEIRDLTRDAKTALEALDHRIGEIGEIATVIGGISDETNLLSLNAAIIAAQAGEHGAAFAVVADQVKTLARRTTESTQEIERLIETVQRESENAVRAMGAGIESVEKGVGRSRGAGDALERIRTSSSEASERVAEIARATEAQANNSKHVAEAARRTSEQVQQISAAIAAQTKASDQLLRNADVALEMCRQMSTATQEQYSSGRYIQSNIEAVTEMIHSIQRNTRSHEKASHQVAETFSAILDNARKSRARIPEVSGAVGELRQQAEAMIAEVERFEIADDPD